MENFKADNIAEKRFRSGVTQGGQSKQGKLSLCKKHLYQGLSINSCSVDISAIKNALMKHQQIYSKIPTVSAVPGTSPVVPFSKSFSIRNTYFQEHLRVLFILFYFIF